MQSRSVPPPSGPVGIPEAADQLWHLGFVLFSSFPEGSGDAELLVALREQPTLEHFDPELVRYWRTGDDRRGHQAELTRHTPIPLEAGFSWGRIEVVDRYGIANGFVTLGGSLTVAAAAPDVTVAIFRSPGPVLRFGGHSQAVDRGALDLGAFFGRIMVPIDFQPGAEAAISNATPLERYAAFVAFEHARYALHPALSDEHPSVGIFVRHEAERMRLREPASWVAGLRLLKAIDLAD